MFNPYSISQWVLIRNLLVLGYNLILAIGKFSMKCIFALSLLFLIATQVASESCSWQYGVTCPITSLYSPVCGAEYPKRIDDKNMGITICSYENPRFLGGEFEVYYNVPGNIVEITNGELHNCGFGTGIGTRQFIAHCKGTGTDKIHGSWFVKYSGSSAEEIVEIKNLKSE